MRWILLLFLLGSAPALPQKKAPKKTTSAAVPNRWPIESLTVEGNHNYTKEQILSVAGLKVGQLAGKQDFETARERLIASGVFESVGYRFEPSKDSGAYAASFQVVEVEPTYPVRFENLGVPSDDLMAWMKRKDPFFGNKIPATKELLERDSRAIEEFLASKNVKEKVLGKVTADAPDQFSIVFRPARAEPVIAEVRFEGNQAILSTVLLNTFAGVAYGSPYSEAAFRQLLDSSVRPLYEARGRLRVAFPKIKAEPAKEVKGILVTVTVDEGPSYELGDVRVATDTKIAPETLVKVGDFKKGDIANFDEITAGVERIIKRLRREGYMKADIRVDRAVNDKLKTVDLTIKVDAGPQFTFGQLTIEGLDLNGEAEIKKLWALKPGKPFNGDYPDFFLNRVREDQLFENLGKTRSAVKVDEQNHSVDVTLYFR